MGLQEQVDNLLAQQGADATEDDLHGAVVAYGGAVTSPGVNDTRIVLLDSGTQAFHKPFSGINTAVALAYDHHPDQVPINECAAWRLATALDARLVSIVAPCVMWSYQGEAGSLTRRLEGVNGTAEPLLRATEQCRTAALFDALIAQQDRHFGNIRWDAASQRVGLYDHGYTLALPGHRLNEAAFVAWRWRTGAQVLEPWEHDALDRLVSDHDLLGLRPILLRDRADALEDRARQMLAAGMLLGVGEF